MFNVLVVEDELLTRQTIVKLISNSNLPVSHVYEAFNGKKALDIMCMHDVQMVLTDIKMPELDGIEFIKQAATKYTDSEFYVISGYDEFTIVSNAYKLKVKDYILKTEISQEHINKLLKGVLDSMKEKQSKKISDSKNSFINQYFYKKEHSIKEAIFKHAIETPVISSDEYSAALAEFPKIFGSGKLCIMTLQIGILTTEYDTRYANIYENILQAIGNLYTCELLWYKNRLVLFVSLEGERSHIKCFNHMFSLYILIKNTVHGRYSLYVSGGMSMHGMNYREISMMYQKSVIALESCFFKGIGRLVTYDEIFNEYLVESKFDESVYIKRLLNILQQTFTADETLTRAETLCVNLDECCLSDIGKIRNLFSKYYIYINDYIKTKWYASNFDELFSIYNNSLKYNAVLTDLNDWIRKIFQLFVSFINGDGQIIGKVKKYIHNNYNKKITIEDVAGSLGISGNYISRLFSKQEGCSFIDYVTKVRINSALDLMRNSNMKLYMISSQVGFLNAETFCRAFKRVMGKCPREYFKQ